MIKLCKKMAASIGGWLMLAASVFLCQTVSAQSESVSCASHPNTMSGYCPDCGCVPINSTNFPDPTFRDILSTICSGEAMSPKQAESVTSIIMGSKGKIQSLYMDESINLSEPSSEYSRVKDWTGISYLTHLDTFILMRGFDKPYLPVKLNLKELKGVSCFCLDYSVEEVDLEQLPNLKDLTLSNYIGKKLSITNTPGLEYLTLWGTVEQIELAACPDLRALSLGCPNLMELDLSGIKNPSCWIGFDRNTSLNASCHCALTHLSSPVDIKVVNGGKFITCHSEVELSSVDDLKNSDPHIDMSCVSNFKVSDDSYSYYYDVKDDAGVSHGSLFVSGPYVVACPHTADKGYCPLCGSLPINEVNFSDENLRKALKETFSVESTIPAERVPELHRIAVKMYVDAEFKDKVYSSDHFEVVKDWTGISYFIAIDTFGVMEVEGNLPALPNLKWCSIETYGGESLNFSESKDLSFAFVSNAAKLTSLVVDGCENLETLALGNSTLESLNVSDNARLVQLAVASPNLNSLNLSANTELSYLVLAAPVAELDLSQNEKLSYLVLEDSLLTDLDLSKNVDLEMVQINNTSLSSLDLTNNKKLSFYNFYFIHNGMTVESLPCLFKLSELNPTIDDERVVEVGGVDSVKVGETYYLKALGETIFYTYDVNNEEIDPLPFYISATVAEHSHSFKDNVCERCGEERIVTSLADEAQLSLSVYPSPAVDYISVTGEVSSYKVIGLLGETVMEGADAQRINVSSLTSGTYLIRLVAKDGSVRLTSFLKK